MIQSNHAKPVLFLLSRVLGGKTFSSHLMRVVEGMGHIKPHYVFLDEDDWLRFLQETVVWDIDEDDAKGL